MTSIRPRRLVPLVSSILVLLPVGPLLAQDPPGEEDVPRIEAGLSVFDVSGRLGEHLGAEVAVQPGWTTIGGGRPVAGLLVATDGPAYVYGGVERPLELHRRVSLSLSLGIGAYAKGGAVDLGNVVEFRTGVKAGVDLPGSRSLTVSFYHLSNAGLGRLNPGLEVLGLGYSVPF